LSFFDFDGDTSRKRRRKGTRIETGSSTLRATSQSRRRERRSTLRRCDHTAVTVEFVGARFRG
jgi:hypothetical protein